MKDVIIKYLPEFLSVAGATVITWFVGRKAKTIELNKAKEELESAKSKNIEDNLELYQRMIDDIDERSRKRIEDLVQQIELLRERYNKLEEEFDDYKSKHP